VLAGLRARREVYWQKDEMYAGTEREAYWGDSSGAVAMRVSGPLAGVERWAGKDSEVHWQRIPGKAIVYIIYTSP
jgi:hypothetical protein